MAFRMAAPPDLVDINMVEGLDVLAVEGGKLRIGARVRHASLGDGRVPGALGQLLTKVMRNIAHPPIRSRGTFCGSIAHSDPASEWCAVAAALDGEIVANSIRGERVIEVADYFQAVMTTSLEPDELVSEVRLCLIPDQSRTGFVEFSHRAGDFALAMCLASFEISDGRVLNPRLAIGGAEAFPRRLTEVEQMLSGSVVAASTWRQAAELAAELLEPLEDSINPLEYRRDLARSVVFRALEQAAS
jgi:carbon-monoxide dehydrogenase medium subunit